MRDDHFLPILYSITLQNLKNGEISLYEIYDSPFEDAYHFYLKSAVFFVQWSFERGIWMFSTSSYLTKNLKGHDPNP